MALPKNEQKPVPRSGISSAKSAPTTTSMVLQRLNDMNTRLRLTEQRINQNRERLRVFDDQIIDNKKTLSNEINNVSEEIGELRKSIKNIDDTIHHIIKELELTAKKQELEVIEKYVNMMDPTRYVTKEEMKKHG